MAINEFGLQVSPKTLTPEHYSAVRDRFYEAILSDGERLGLEGLLAWGALPEIELDPGHYSVRESHVNSYSPTEVDIDARDHTRRRVLFYEPHFSLFEWRNDTPVPTATAAAKAIASAWAGIPPPSRIAPHAPKH